MRDLETSGPNQSGLPTAQQAWVVLHAGEGAVEERRGVAEQEGFSVTGEARNTATRLSTVAEPGTIVMSSATHKQVGSSFECESLGERRVRGLAQPMELFKVTSETESQVT